MMSLSKSFRFICVSYKPNIVKTVNDLLCVNGIRFCSTNTRAVQKFSFQRTKKKKFKEAEKYFLLLIPICSFGLGTWQVLRKFEKEKIIKEFMETIKLPPVELPKNLEELENMEFRQIKVRGTFDHSKELFLGPRPLITEEPYNVGSTLLSKDKGGFMVVTPFKLADRDLTILVNRGWVPRTIKSPLTRPEGQITEEVELVGLVRLHETRQPLGMKNLPEVGSWVYRDLYKMAEVTGAAPVFLEANKESTVVGGPIGGQTIVEIRNTHVSYIYTWYGLAFMSSWMWYKKYCMTKKIYGFHYIHRQY